LAPGTLSPAETVQNLVTHSPLPGECARKGLEQHEPLDRDRKGEIPLRRRDRSPPVPKQREVRPEGTSLDRESELDRDLPESAGASGQRWHRIPRSEPEHPGPPEEADPIQDERYSGGRYRGGDPAEQSLQSVLFDRAEVQKGQMEVLTRDRPAPVP